MKMIRIVLLAWSMPLFAQKPAIQQENYNWNQDIEAIISDNGNFVLTQGRSGLSVYQTASGRSTCYAKAFNGKISSNEKLIAFQKPKDTLAMVHTRDHSLVNIDSVSDFQLLPASDGILLQKVNGALCYYHDFKSFPITFAAVNKYVVDQSGSKVYYSDQEGFLVSYSFLNQRIDTVFLGGDITNFQVNNGKKEIVVQVKQDLQHDIIVIKANKTRISLRQLLHARLEIMDQAIQLEQPTGKIYFKTVEKKAIKVIDPGAKYSGMQVWNYKDPYLYPMLLQEHSDSSHYCVFDPDRNTVLDFGATRMDYSIHTGIANPFIIGLTPINVFERHWRESARASCFLFNTNTGESKEIYHEMEGYLSVPFQLQLDPKQQYLLYYDLARRKYRAYHIASGVEAILGNDPALIFDNVDEDPSSSPSPYGIAGWSGNGRFVYVYDQYDIWKLDIEGVAPPACVTQETGRRTNRRFRLVSTGEEVLIKETDNLLLSCFDVETRDNGFYALNIRKNSIRSLIMDARLYFNPGGSIPGVQPVRSLNKKYWLFQSMSASEYPNYFITEQFEKIIPVTRLEPQADYHWMRSKLVKLGEGHNKVEGVLYVPESFDTSKKYPIIFYLYEKFTDGVHQYLFPRLSDGTLNIPWYVSNGYLVFCPDVHYSTNAPGESVLRTVKTARDYFAGQSFIDSGAMGLQGHSFGGYEVNYIVTHYGGFAAACAVSGAANLFTSYGNIRQGGMSGQIDFERGQFRMRKPIWEMPEVFLANSPVSSTGNVTTPLLLVSNKADSTVLWSHAVEMFTAMRRQEKPCWLLQYDHSHHVISTEDGPDFSIRMQQFFDFYLKHLEQPGWMKAETPARERSLFPR